MIFCRNVDMMEKSLDFVVVTDYVNRSYRSRIIYATAIAIMQLPTTLNLV
jgi:hypothetical protein